MKRNENDRVALQVDELSEEEIKKLSLEDILGESDDEDESDDDDEDESDDEDEDDEDEDSKCAVKENANQTQQFIDDLIVHLKESQLSTKYSPNRQREPVKTMIQKQIAQLKKKKSATASSTSVTHAEDINALMAGETGLTEEFKAKAETIFETAVNRKAEIIESQIVSIAESVITTKIEEVTTLMGKQVDAYLDYVVDHWIKTNELAIEQGLRTEIAEEFMTGLHQLFKEHYVEVPESKIDLVDQLSEAVKALKKDLSEAVNIAIELREENRGFKREVLIAEQMEGLSQVQAEKLTSLLEGIEYSDEEDLVKKIKILKTSYIVEKPRSSDNKELSFLGESTEDNEIADVRMQRYIDALKRSGS